MNHPYRITRRSFLKAGAAAAAMSALGANASAAAPETENCLFASTHSLRSTRFGPVQGFAEGRHLSWYGIPYAAAPAGELRWRAPADPAPWSAPRDCTARGPVACQYAAGPIGTEDCLRLDVCSTPGAFRRPVLVYLHGGGNQSGSTQELDGGELAERLDCVFVAPGYRLGLPGFNCLPSLRGGPEDTGNFALLDLARALDWVQENIEQFGGDPENVTVCGFSSGGSDVLAMLYSPLFAGRFHKAVSLSGGLLCADEAASARRIAAAIAPVAVEDGLFSSVEAAQDWLLGDSNAVRSWLYSLDASELSSLMRDAALRLSRFPFLYADGAALPREGFASAPVSKVPVMLLSSATEFSLFAQEDDYFRTGAGSALPAEEAEAARSFAVEYGSALFRQFNTGRTAELLSRHSDAPLYLCEIEYGASTSRTVLPTLGAFHGICLPMLSNTHPFIGLADFSGSGYQAMAEKFRTFLRHFLATGDPNDSGRLEVQTYIFLKDAPPLWRPWTPEDPASYVLDADAQHLVSDCRDVSVDCDALFRQMDEDARLSPARKLELIQTVLNGRWFSEPLDKRYRSPSLWE